MSLFGPNRPKGITKDELRFVRGELGSAAFGRGAEKLTTRQVDYVVELLEMALDADTPEEIKYHWEQVSQSEERHVEDKIADDSTVAFSDAQRAHVHQVLQKYIDINRVKSLF